MKIATPPTKVSMSLEDAMDYTTGLLTDAQIRKTGWLRAVERFRSAMRSSLTKKNYDKWMSRKVRWAERSPAKHRSIIQAFDASDAVRRFVFHRMPEREEGELIEAAFDIEQAWGRIYEVGWSTLKKSHRETSRRSKP